MALPVPLSAQDAKVRVGGQILVAAAWDVNPESALLPVNNFEGGGYEDDIHGLRRCEVTIEGWWDSANNMHDAPMSIQDNSVLTNVKLYVADTDGPYWDFPKLNVRGVPMTARVEDRVLYRLVGKAKGTFTYPTGNVA